MLFQLHTMFPKLAAWAIIPFLILLFLARRDEDSSALGYVLLGLFMLYTLCKGLLNLLAAWQLLITGRQAKAQVTYVYNNRRRWRDDIRVSINGRELNALNSYPLMNKPREGETVSVLCRQDASCALILGNTVSYWIAPVLELSVFCLLAFLYAKIILFT